MIQNSQTLKVWTELGSFFFIWIFLCGVLAGGVFIFFDRLGEPTNQFALTGNCYFLLTVQLAMLCGTILSIYYVEKNVTYTKPEASIIAEKWEMHEVFMGLLFGASIMALCVTILLVSGAIDLHFMDVGSGLICFFISFLFVAIIEELVFRKFIYVQLLRVYKNWTSIILTSLMFSLIHSLNPSIGWTGFVNLFLSGVIFSQLYVRKRELSSPIGFHFGWNFFQGAIFGSPVSGLKIDGIFALHYESGDIINGGLFGLEGSIITMAILIVVILLLLFLQACERLQS